MRYKTDYRVFAKLVDHNGSDIVDKKLIASVDGLACVDDTVLNYTDLEFATEYNLKGGYPRLVTSDKGRLQCSVEIDCNRQLSTRELKALREDFLEQLTDGIGAGCFSFLSSAAGISVAIVFPVKSTCTQSDGKAWRGSKTTVKANDRKLSAIKKLIDKADSADGSKKPAVVKGKSSAKGKAAKVPNYSKLLRLLAKPERNSLFDQIDAELNAIGNDLSQLPDGTYPYGNHTDTKLLNRLLKAGLSPEAADAKGYTMLYQASGTPACLSKLLSLKVDVNRICTDVNGSTALMRAAFLGSLKCVQLLLAAGANASIRTRFRKTALDMVDSRSRNREEIVAILKKAM